MVTAIKNNFGFTTIAWHEIGPKLELNNIEDLLENNIDLSKYGSGIHQIYFLYIAVQPDNTIHEEETLFFRRHNRLMFSLKLDYLKLFEADKSEVRRLMAECFLSSIDLYRNLGVQNFDIPAFKEDVCQLFKNQGWIK